MSGQWHDPPGDVQNEPPEETKNFPPGPPQAGGSRVMPIVAMVLILVSIGLAFVLWRDAVTAALIFLVILIGLVLVHEAGHFLTAKMFGVYVHEFGVGFPPRIWGKRIGETEYTVNWLPIGGFVRLEGEENPESPRSLAAKPRWQRFIVLVSGGVVNLVLPILLFAAALTVPHQEAIGRAVITAVEPGAPAAEAGLQIGDVIHAVDGRDAQNVAEASRLVQLNAGETIEITVRRDGQLITIPVDARSTPPEGQGPTGIAIAARYPFTETVSVPPWESIPMGAQQTWETLILARNEIAGWFEGSGGPQFAGPVGIAQTTGVVAESAETTTGAVSSLLQLAALLSLNLGIINLLPLPMLDGGRVLFLVIEILRGGKRIAPEREALVHLVGFVMFIALAIVITFLDISRIASGDSVFR